MLEIRVVFFTLVESLKKKSYYLHTYLTFCYRYMYLTLDEFSLGVTQFIMKRSSSCVKDGHLIRRSYR